jgi:Rrf2 family protein
MLARLGNLTGDPLNLHKSTRYALHSMLELTLADERPVTVAQVATRWDIPESALAKVLQQLVRTGFIRSVRGVNGGYLLARPAAGVSVQDIIDSFEPAHADEGCLLKDLPGAECPADGPMCRLRELFEEVDQTTRATFQSVTFDTLSR